MRTLTCILSFAALVCSIGRVGAADAPRPNVLLIVADDLGYGELGCQGNPQIPTPHIDSLARNGIRFTNAYVSAPICSPSRAGLLTGRYQQRFGYEFNFPPPDGPSNPCGLPVSEKTLADRLRALGYATGAIGKWHLGYRPEFHPRKRGFDEFYGFLGGMHPYLKANDGNHGPILRDSQPVADMDYTTDAFGREACAFIEKHRARPWFVYLAFNAVHGPLQASDQYLARFPKIANADRRAYAAMQSAMDDAVGAVLAKLRELQVEENTLIIFLSDNGGPTWQTTSRNDPLRGAKKDLLEGGIREPFLMQWKGHLPAGKIDHRPIISLDIVPSALAASGAPAVEADQLDGVNLLPYLTGQTAGEPHKALCWRYGSQRAVRQGDWKLLRIGNRTHLYQLADDLGETKDLAATEPARVKELEAVYDAWNAKNIRPKWRAKEGRSSH